MKSILKNLLNKLFGYKYELAENDLKVVLVNFYIFTNPQGITYKVSQDFHIIELVAGVKAELVGQQYFSKEYADSCELTPTLDQVRAAKLNGAKTNRAGVFEVKIERGKVRRANKRGEKTYKLNPSGNCSWAKLGRFPNVLSESIASFSKIFFFHTYSENYKDNMERKYYPIRPLVAIK